MGGGGAVQDPAAPLLRLVPSRDGQKARERVTHVLAEHAVPGRAANAKTLCGSSCLVSRKCTDTSCSGQTKRGRAWWEMWKTTPGEEASKATVWPFILRWKRVGNSEWRRDAV